MINNALKNYIAAVMIAILGPLSIIFLGLVLIYPKDIQMEAHPLNIHLKIIIPPKYFKDPFENQLSSYSSKFKATKDGRVSNIKLVAEKINNIIIEPGKEFSFNNATGPRTEAEGFQNAPIYFAGLKMEGMAGGTCQVSSTLYAAAMYAHLKITHRFPHTRPSSYLPISMDATVDYGMIDFKFINPYNTPIKISTSLISEDNIDYILTIQILGREKDFEVVTVWKSTDIIPFETRYIETKYLRTNQKKKQTGKDGTPGYRLWMYLTPEGKRIEQLAVPSKYKPVDEIWLRNSRWQ